MMSMSKWLPDGDWQSGIDSIPKWALYSGIGVGLGLATACITWYCQPPPVVKFRMSVAMKKAGFSSKRVKGSVHTYTYAERGCLRSDQPSFLCISGFSGCKEDWLLIANGIQDDFHVILLDLPGQGQSSVPVDPEETSIYAFRDMLAEFTRLTDMEVIPMHVVGISLGASLAALYTAKYPTTVDRLTIVCPSMQCPIETEAWQEFAVGGSSGGKNGSASLDNSTFYDPSRKSNIWKFRCLQQKEKSKQEFQRKLRARQFMELTEESSKFEESLALIKVPTQIIWGENDEILHVSGASLLEELMPCVKRVDILEECGHDLHLEKPDIAQGLIMDFHNTTYSP